MSQKLAPFDALNKLSLWQRLSIKLDSYACTISPLAFQFCFTVIFILIVGINWISVSKHPELALTITSILGLFATFTGRGLFNDQGQSSTLKLLRMLPYSSENIYKKLKQQAFLASTGWFFEFLIVYLAVISPQVSFSSVVAAVLGAVIQWGIVCSMTLAWLRLRINPQVFPPILLLSAIVLPFVASDQPSMQHQAFLLHNIINPLGWVNAAFFEEGVKQHGVFLLSLLPSLALVTSLPRLEKAVHQMFHAGDFQNPLRENSFSFFIPKNGSIVTKMCEEGLSPVSLENQGWIERLLSKYLTKQGQTVLEFEDFHRYKFSRAYGIIWIGLIGHLVIGWIAIHYLNGFFPAIDRSRVWLFVGCFLSEMFVCAMVVFFSLPMVLFSGRTDLVQFQNWVLSFTSPRLFPISYWTTAKTNIRVQTYSALLLAVPVLIFDLVPGAFSLLEDLPQTPFFGIKALLCLWCGSICKDAFSIRRRYSSQDLRYWIEGAKQAGILLLLIRIACAMFDKKAGFWSFLWGTVLAGGTWIWFLYSAARYCRIPFIQFLSKRSNLKSS